MIRTFTEEQVLQAYTAAPELIKDTLSGDMFVDFIVNLQANYGLHIDTSGVVSVMIRNTLLGIMDPSEFFSGLLELGMNPDDAKRLTNDLNTRIFIPIHQKMMEGDNQSSQTTPNSVPVPSYAPVQTPSVSKIESQLAPAAAAQPVVPAPTVPAPHEIPVPTYAMPQASPQTPSVPPHIIAAPAPMPTATVQTSSVSALDSSAPAIPTPPAPPAPTQSSANHEALKKVMKEYGIDPYREPVDEK